MVRDLEDWEQDILDASKNTAQYHREILQNIAVGNRIVLDDVGDVTDEEEKKARWFLAHFEAIALRIERGSANDNDPPMDEELADLIAGDW